MKKKKCKICAHDCVETHNEIQDENQTLVLDEPIFIEPKLDISVQISTDTIVDNIKANEIKQIHQEEIQKGKSKEEVASNLSLSCQKILDSITKDENYDLEKLKKDLDTFIQYKQEFDENVNKEIELKQKLNDIILQGPESVFNSEEHSYARQLALRKQRSIQNMLSGKAMFERNNTSSENNKENFENLVDSLKENVLKIEKPENLEKIKNEIDVLTNKIISDKNSNIETVEIIETVTLPNKPIKENSRGSFIFENTMPNSVLEVKSAIITESPDVNTKEGRAFYRAKLANKTINDEKLSIKENHALSRLDNIAMCELSPIIKYGEKEVIGENAIDQFNSAILEITKEINYKKEIETEQKQIITNKSEFENQILNYETENFFLKSENLENNYLTNIIKSENEKNNIISEPLNNLALNNGAPIIHTPKDLIYNKTKTHKDWGEKFLNIKNNVYKAPLYLKKLLGINVITNGLTRDEVNKLDLVFKEKINDCVTNHFNCSIDITTEDGLKTLNEKLSSVKEKFLNGDDKNLLIENENINHD